MPSLFQKRLLQWKAWAKTTAWNTTSWGPVQLTPTGLGEDTLTSATVASLLLPSQKLNGCKQSLTRSGARANAFSPQRNPTARTVGSPNMYNMAKEASLHTHRLHSLCTLRAAPSTRDCSLVEVVLQRPRTEALDFVDLVVGRREGLLVRDAVLQAVFAGLDAPHWKRLRPTVL